MNTWQWVELAAIQHVCQLATQHQSTLTISTNVKCISSAQPANEEYYITAAYVVDTYTSFMHSAMYNMASDVSQIKIYYTTMMQLPRLLG